MYLGREGEAVGRVTTVLDEMRAALDRGPAIDPPAALGLAGSLGWFWLASGRLAEGQEQCDRALTGEGSDVDRARVLTSVGNIAALMGDHDAAISRLQAALDIWRALDQRREECVTLDALGWAHFWPGHNDAALIAFQTGLELARELDATELIRHHMAGECQILVAIGDGARARPLAEELIRITPSDDLRTTHFGHHFLADCGLLAGDCHLAAREYATALTMARDMDDPVETTIELQGMAMAYAGLGRTQQALTLGGAAEASLEELEVDLEVPFWLAFIDQWLNQPRAAVGADGETWWHNGRQLALEDALELAAQLPSD
jgi:tetratricopeptide (TPR) repeat protein